jgi:hypothetical protein
VSATPTSIDSEAAGHLFTPEAQQRMMLRARTLRDRYRGVSPDRFLNDITDRAIAYSRYADIERARTWARNVEFYKGNHDGHWDNRTGDWVVDQPASETPYYKNNQYGFFVRGVEALWTRSNTVLEIRPTSDDPMCVGASKVASTVQQSMFRRRWKATQRQIEAKNAQLTGNYFRHLWWAKESGVPSWIPKTQQVEIAGEDEGYQCLECGTAGPLGDNPSGSMMSSAMAYGAPLLPMGPDGSCPSCHSQNLDQFGLPSFTMDVVTGQEQIDGGDVMIEPVDPMEMTLHLHAPTYEMSPFAIRRRLFLAEILQDHFPGCEISFSQTTDLRLIYQRAIQTTPSSQYSMLLDGGLQGMSEFEEVWLEPAMYSHYITPEFIAGDIQLDPKTKMIEMFPKGIFLSRIGGKIVDGPWPESKQVGWVHGRFDIIPNAVWGRGQDDAVAANDRLNEAGTLWFEILMHQASRLTAYNPLRFNAEDITGSPRDLPELQNATLDDKPSEFIWQSTPGGAPPDVPRYIEYEQSNMQSMFAAFSAMMGDSEGRSDPAARTAILRDQATQMHGPSLELKAEADVETGQKGLALYQRNWRGKRFYYSKGLYDDYEGHYFEKADIMGDFEWEAKQGSWMPRGDGERRAAVIEAGNWGGLPLGVFNPQLPPKLQRYLLEEYGLTFDAGDVGPDYRKQRLEIKRLQDLLPMVLKAFQAQGIPAMLPPGVPQMDGSVSQEETPHPAVVQFLARKIPVEIAVLPQDPNVGMSIDNDQVHIQCVNEWLLTDEGMAAHPVLRAALMMHLQEHAMAAVKTANYQSLISIQAQATEIQFGQALAANAPQGPDAGKKTAPPSQAGRPSSGKMERRPATAESGGLLA